MIHAAECTHDVCISRALPQPPRGWSECSSVWPRWKASHLRRSDVCNSYSRTLLCPDTHISIATSAQTCASPSANNVPVGLYVNRTLLPVHNSHKYLSGIKAVPLRNVPWPWQLSSQVPGKHCPVVQKKSMCVWMSCRLDKACQLVCSCVGKFGWRRVTPWRNKYSTDQQLPFDSSFCRK